MRTLVVVAVLALGCAAASWAETRPAPPASATATTAAPPALAVTVRAREAAFAKTLADRDHAAFTAFVSEEAVFVGRTVRRGRKAVAEGWKPFFDGPKAPFAWAPEVVEVIDSGGLALSSGPVFGPDGKRTGTFHSTWRLEPDGVWRIVLDIGCPPCECP
jgi:ketosteroid isomerase-like protein